MWLSARSVRHTKSKMALGNFSTTGSSAVLLRWCFDDKMNFLFFPCVAVYTSSRYILILGLSATHHLQPSYHTNCCENDALANVILVVLIQIVFQLEFEPERDNNK